MEADFSREKWLLKVEEIWYENNLPVSLHKYLPILMFTDGEETGGVHQYAKNCPMHDGPCLPTNVWLVSDGVYFNPHSNEYYDPVTKKIGIAKSKWSDFQGTLVKIGKTGVETHPNSEMFLDLHLRVTRAGF